MIEQRQICRLQTNAGAAGPLVVHVSTVHPPYDGRILLKECCSLARVGYRVVLCAAGERNAEHQGVRIQALPPPTGRVDRVLRTGITACRAVQRMRPQLVHLHDPELLLWAPMWKAAGIRVVYDMHENLSGSVRTKSWIPGLLRSAMSRLVRVIERSLASRCAVVFAEESYVKEHPWVKRYAVVLNMPIADELLRVVGRPPVEFTVGYAGLISQSRGSLLTLEALARLRDDGVGVCWQVAGRFSPPGHEAEIRRRVAELRLTEQVTFHGPVMPREAWKLMADCHCGLAVLRPEPNYLESYPTKLFEYMALGLPVVASDFPLYRRVVQEGKCGICVAPDDGEALARALRTLYNDPGRCWRMGAAGKQAVATRYNWANEEKKLLALYEVVLDSGRAGRS